MKVIQIDANAFYTVHTAALEIGISKDSIQRAIRERKLPTVKRGRQRSILGQYLIDWLKPESEVGNG